GLNFEEIAPVSMSFLLISVVNKVGGESVNVDNILTYKNIFVLALNTERGQSFRFSNNSEDPTIALVNAALYLRRPLLITGRPGTGKSSLIYAVAWELQLGEVLRWSITSHSTLQQGLYHYDAIGRLQDSQLGSRASRQKSLPDIKRYLK